MENLLNDLRRTGQSVETDATLRLPKRPRGNSISNPKVFENFGSSLAPRSSQALPKSKPKSRSTVSHEPTRPVGIKKPLSEFYFNDSEDELDLLSSSQADPDDYRPSKKVPVSKSLKYVDEKGKEHDYNPSFPSKSQVLAKLKFTKIKKLGGEDNTAIPSSSSSSSLKNNPGFKENSQDFGSWKNKRKDNQATGEYSGDNDVLEISTPLRLKSSNRHLSSPRSPPKIHPELSDAPPRPRPLPRPVYKSNASTGAGGSKLSAKSSSQLAVTKNKYPSRSSSPEISTSTPRKKDGTSSQPLISPKDFPMDAISPLGGKIQREPLPKPRNKLNPPSFEASRKPNAFPMPSPQSSDKARTRSKGKTKAQPFPLDGSDENEADEKSDFDNGKARAKGKGKQNQPPSSPQIFPMDMISPLGGKKTLPKPRSKTKPSSFKAPSRKLRAFPMPSPQSSDNDNARSKEKNKVQPFPLFKHQKRISAGLSDEEQTKKKRQSSLSPSLYSFEDEGDSITISPDTDPRTLCPYCDISLPSSPSPLLINILAATRKKSTRDPRPSNPLGLKAPLAIFIVVCQRHKFESQILPEAERKGWPKTIEWKKLGARVERMKDELQALIEDPGGEREVDDDIDEVERLFEDDGGGTRQKRPKARSIFWSEVMDEVKKKGSRAVVGVRGQFADFEKTQPGYYGEQGSVIIHQTLFDMFPPASFDPARISPLTSNEFVLRILVPEVALRLIMEDRDREGNDEMHQALVVLRESSAYGVAMFPEDGGEGSTGKKRRDDVMGVGDKIVMERARKRRKELEEEEEQEEREAAMRIVEMEQVKVNNEKMGGRKRKGKQREEQQLEEQQVPVEKPRPRPRPLAKASSSMSIQPSSDHEEPPQPLQPCVQHESMAMRRSSRKNAIERSDSKMDLDLYDADEDDIDLEIENVLDIKTPVGKHGPSYRATNDTSDEETPKLKPLVLPRTGKSNDIKPLMIAQMRQCQKNDSESKFREADLPRRRSKLRSDERAPDLCVEDITDTEPESSQSYSWLLNDTSQSSMEGKTRSTARRRY